MDYEEKVAFLRQYRDSVRRETLLLEELAELRSRAEGMTRVLNGMPGAPSYGSALPRAVESMIETQRQLYDQVAECFTIRSQVVQAISAVQDETQREVLRRRYILGQRFEVIAEEMCFVPRRIYQLHKKGVNSLKIPDDVSKN